MRCYYRFSYIPGYAPLSSSVSTLQQEVATWSFVQLPIIEESRILNMNKNLNVGQSLSAGPSTINYSNRRDSIKDGSKK